MLNLNKVKKNEPAEQNTQLRRVRGYLKHHGLNKISGFDYYGMMVLKDTCGKPDYEELHPALDVMRSCNILEKMYTKPPPDDAQGLFIRQLVALLAGRKIAPHGSCYIITACPRKLAITLHRLSPKFDPVQLNSGASFTNILRITIPEQLFLP
jgi:hypothetical protein